MRIKHRLRLEALTGLTYLAFQQEFDAKILVDNLHRLLVTAHDEATTVAVILAMRRPNRAFALAALKPILADCFIDMRSGLHDLRAALGAIVRTLCRIQPGRSYPRPPRIKLHLCAAYLTVC